MNEEELKAESIRLLEVGDALARLDDPKNRVAAAKFYGEGAVLLHRSGELELAKVVFQRARVLDPENARAKQFLDPPEDGEGSGVLRSPIAPIDSGQHQEFPMRPETST